MTDKTIPTCTITGVFRPEDPQAAGYSLVALTLPAQAIQLDTYVFRLMPDQPQADLISEDLIAVSALEITPIAPAQPYNDPDWHFSEFDGALINRGSHG